MTRSCYMSVVVACGSLLALATISSKVHAVPIASYSHSGSPVPTIAPDGTNYTLGHEFTTSQVWQITAFGYNANTQFTGTHGVALFRVSDQSLLGTASVIVPGANSNLTDFVYTTLAIPIELPAGTYRIGGATNGQGYVYQGGLAGIINAPGVTYIAGYYAAGFPTYPNIANVNWLTTNFLFSEVPQVPEPSTLALLGLGAIGLAIRTRRRRTV